MADSKKKIGNPDRSRVSATQSYEVDHIARKFELPAQLVRNVIQQVGPMRADVESYLRKMKRA